MTTSHQTSHFQCSILYTKEALREGVRKNDGQNVGILGGFNLKQKLIIIQIGLDVKSRIRLNGMNDRIKAITD